MTWFDNKYIHLHRPDMIEHCCLGRRHKASQQTKKYFKRVAQSFNQYHLSPMLSIHPSGNYIENKVKPPLPLVPLYQTGKPRRGYLSKYLELQSTLDNWCRPN